jgi:hypothetical protein
MQLNAAIQRRAELLFEVSALQQKIDYYRPPKAADENTDKPEAPNLPNEAAIKAAQKLALQESEEQVRLDKVEADNAAKSATDKYAVDKAYYERIDGLAKTHYALNQISLAEETQQLVRAEAERYASELKMLDDKQHAYLLDAQKQKEIQLEIEKAAIEHSRTLEQINGQAALKIQQQFEQIARPIGSAFGGAITGMLTKTETLQQGLANIGQTIVSTMVDKVINYILDEWIIAEGVKLWSSLTSAEGQQTAAETAAVSTAVISKAAAVQQIMASAAVAAAAAFAATAAIPFFGPEAAPAAAVAAFGATASWAGFVAAEGGMWNVPGDEFPILAHAGESVLPANIAESMRDFFGGGGAAGDGGNTMHFYGPLVQMGGAASPEATARALTKALRNFTIRS